MSIPTTEQRPLNAWALASLLVALLSLGQAYLSFRPEEPGDSYWPFYTALASLVMAGLGIKGVCQRRAATGSLLTAVAGIVLALLAINTARGARAFVEGINRRVAMANGLRQLALSLRGYEEEHGTLPPAAVYGNDGRPLLSWRVLVLPYLERDGAAEPGLFQQFQLDEPWDGPHNLPLLQKMPKPFAPPEGVPRPHPTATHYRVFVGKGAAFKGREGVKLSDFSDGTDETFLVVEAGEAVPWTKPEELPYAPDQPLPKLGAAFRSGFYASLADASTRFVRRETSEATLRAAVTRNGGDKLGTEW